MSKLKTVTIVLLVLLLLAATSVFVLPTQLRTVSAGSQSCGFGGTCWYTGEEFQTSTANTGTTVSAEILVPNNYPQAGNDNYFVINSIFDESSNYDQIGLWAANGVWDFQYGYATNCGASGQDYYDNQVYSTFAPQDMINFTMRILNSSSMIFIAHDITHLGASQNVTLDFANGGQFSTLGYCTSDLQYTNYEEQHMSCSDVPTGNFLFTNNTIDGTKMNSWPTTYANSPQSGATCSGFPNQDNATAIGQDQGGYNDLIYNLYNRQDSSLSSSMASVSLAYSSSSLYAALTDGTCVGGGSCASLYSGSGSQPTSYSQVFSKVPGEGDGVASQTAPVVATGKLGYLNNNPAVVYAWVRASDNHILVSYLNETSNKWYGPFDSGIAAYSASTPSVVIGPDPNGNNAIWIGYAASSSQEVSLMYSDDGGLAWNQATSSSQYAQTSVSLALNTGTGNSLFVGWIGTNNDLEVATFDILTQSWSNPGSFVPSSTPAPCFSIAYVNTTHPFLIATWENPSSDIIQLVASTYQYIPSSNDFVPTLSYGNSISTTASASNTQSVASTSNIVALGFIYSSTSTFNTYWMQF